MKPRLLASITEDLVGFPNLSWDQAPDPFDSLQGADVLVSDKSGIVFDFAFVFRRPVISIKFDYDRAGMEASDLPGELWEETVLDKIGFQLDENDVSSLPERISEMVASNEYEQSIRSVIESGCFNLGQAGPVSARQILDIQQEVVGSIGATSAGSSIAPPS